MQASSDMTESPESIPDTPLVKALLSAGARRGDGRKRLLDIYGGANRSKAAQTLDEGLTSGLFRANWHLPIQQFLGLSDGAFATLLEVQDAWVRVVEEEIERQKFRPFIAVRWGPRVDGGRQPLFVLALLHGRSSVISVPMALREAEWPLVLDQMSALIAVDRPAREQKFRGLVGDAIVRYDYYAAYGVTHRFSPEGQYLATDSQPPPPRPSLHIGGKDMTKLF